MDGQRFDNLTKTLATGVSRRRLLKGLTGGALGSALAAIGLGSASAQVLRCDRGQIRCRAASGDYCANLREDPNNCGRCGTVCESGVCHAGRCQSVESGCPTGFEECQGTCVRAGNCAPVIVVSPANMQGWEFFTENDPGGFGEMVYGPASPPRGAGSARLVLTSNTQGMALGAGIHGGTRLADLHTIQYSTYRTSGASAEIAAAFQFSVDYDPTDGNDGWQGRLIYEPYRTETVVTGQWQTWNPLAGLWWSSGAPGTDNCPQNSPCTWQQVLSHYPEARIHPTLTQVLFKVGSGWDEFDGNVDALVINNTTYDFEPEPA